MAMEPPLVIFKLVCVCVYLPMEVSMRFEHWHNQAVHNPKHPSATYHNGSGLGS